MTVPLTCLVFVSTLFKLLVAEAPRIALNDGNTIPVLALGTGRGTASEQGNLDEVRHAVFNALKAGYRHIDTASIYDDEEYVGLGIADAIAKANVTRDDVFVTTKLWNNRHRKEQVVPSLKESLKRLGLKYVDLYLIHFPIAMKDDGSAASIDFLNTWRGMEEAKNLGLTKSIGVSNFNEQQINRLVANGIIKPAVNQIEVNPTLTQEHLVERCNSLGIVVMAYSPFGFLVERKNKNSLPPAIDDPELVKMAQKYGKTTPQIVLRYLIDRGLIPIPKSTNTKRIIENIDLFDFNLTLDEMRTIGKFNKNIRVISAIQWKNFPEYPFEKNSLYIK